MLRIFAIGITGWIGGDAAFCIAAAHPEHSWTCLVRNADKANMVSKYMPPGTRFVHGDYDSHDLIATESASADVVLNFGTSDYVALARSVIQGLSRRTTPGYFISVSGAGLLMWDDMHSKKYGKESHKVYDDQQGIHEVLSFPDEALHRPMDKTVLASYGPNVKTAIVSPPLIYGTSRVSENEHSVVGWAIKAMLDRGKPFRIGDGMARASTVHIHDLSNVFLRLVEEAAQGGGNATWGSEAYYFAEAGEIAWGELLAQLGRVAFDKGLIASTDMETLSEEEALQINPLALLWWGTNARCKALRARKLLGWTPVMPSLLNDAIQNWRWTLDNVSTLKAFEI